MTNRITQSEKIKSTSRFLSDSVCQGISGKGGSTFSGKEVSCKVCGKLIYRPKHKLVKTKNHYCSRACSTIGRRKGEYRSCKVCQKRFYVTLCNINKGFGIYCEKKCWYADHNIECKCEVCGKIFNRTKSKKVRFCSKKCQASAFIPWNKGRAGEYTFPQARTGKYLICLYCGEKFYRPKWREKLNTCCCCEEHQWLYQQGKNTLKIACRGCGKIFQVKIKFRGGVAKGTARSFCSNECHTKNFSAKIVFCAICAKAVPRYRSSLKNRNHIFCSRDCKDKGEILEYGLTKKTGKVQDWEGRISIATQERYERAPDGRLYRKYKLEHRMKIAEFIGRPLKYNDEPVLHLNGVLSDNRLENTYVCASRSEMMRIMGGSLLYPTKSNINLLKANYKYKMDMRK